jgi:hypothetical protein
MRRVGLSAALLMASIGGAVIWLIAQDLVYEARRERICGDFTDVTTGACDPLLRIGAWPLLGAALAGAATIALSRRRTQLMR